MTANRFTACVLVDMYVQVRELERSRSFTHTHTQILKKNILAIKASLGHSLEKDGICKAKGYVLGKVRLHYPADASYIYPLDICNTR